MDLRKRYPVAGKWGQSKPAPFACKLFFFLTFLISSFYSHSQTSQSVIDSAQNIITVIPGKQYYKNKWHRIWWGSHYRNEWSRPVKVKIVSLDTLAGGLTPTELGGGRQTKTLRLENAKGKEYVLRSIDKDLSGALPEIFKGTFIESLIRDQASIAHPYAAITVTPMIQAAGIFHTNPRIVYVPEQERLGKFNKDFANTFALFEERPDDNQEDAPNFGFSKEVEGTDKLFDSLFHDHHHRVDQLAYVRARLFDMFVGDWGRHEDQWRWASFREGNNVVYKPIPRDRDQTYSLFEGLLVKLAFALARLGHLQSFDADIKDVPEYNFPARNLDRLLANEPTLQQWTDIARDLQQVLTDSLIENSVQLMPPEVYPLSGPEIIAKLKSRRNKLVEIATEYYHFLAEEVEITGSAKPELFQVDRLDNEQASVKIFKLSKDGIAESDPFYSRIFKSQETKEIRLYGLEGNDVFHVLGQAGQSIKIRLIPGKGSDSIKISGEGKAGSKIRVYDDEGSGIEPSPLAKIYLSNDEKLNAYLYDAFEFNKKGITVKPGNRVGVGYRFRREKWRKEPFGFEHSLIAYYTITRGGVALEYKAQWPQLIGKWNASLLAKTEFPYVAFFFGVGNNSKQANMVNRFYRMRINEWYGGFNINRFKDSTHYFEFSPYFQSIEVRNDPDKFVGMNMSGITKDNMRRRYFASTEAEYRLFKANDFIVPSKGLNFMAGAGYTQNLKDGSRGFARFSSSLAFYFPLARNVSLAFRAGGATLRGEAEFYQLNRLGGNENLRGYLRERFYAKTTFFNNNEIRWVLNTRNRVFNGKIGLLAFVDQGRAWHPGETSSRWHVGYGPGIVIAPFNKLWFNATYGISSVDQVLHIQLGFFF